MKKLIIIGIIGCLFIIFHSCEKEEDKVCFSVSNFDVSVRNLYEDGHVVELNVEFLVSLDSDYTHNNQTFHFVFSNIVKDATKVLSFDCTIDNKNYSYPTDKCN